MIGNRDIQNLHIVNHPLVLHKLSHLRNESTPTSTFRALLREIALLIGYEITRELEMAEHTVQTPVAKTIAPVLKGKKPAIVPILRAGLGMAEGLEELLPTAPIGHIGLNVVYWAGSLDLPKSNTDYYLILILIQSL